MAYEGFGEYGEFGDTAPAGQPDMFFKPSEVYSGMNQTMGGKAPVAPGSSTGQGGQVSGKSNPLNLASLGPSSAAFSGGIPTWAIVAGVAAVGIVTWMLFFRPKGRRHGLGRSGR